MSVLQVTSFRDFLVERRFVSAEQLAEADSVVEQTGATLRAALTKLGLMPDWQFVLAEAQFLGLPSVTEVNFHVPPTVLEMIPESVARENIVLPVAIVRGVLIILMSEFDEETLQKLQFILNRDIQPMLAPREAIIEAINRNYGNTETESVDSMLQEFTDTQIEFNEREARDEHCEADDDSALLEMEVTPAPRAAAAATPVERQATIRYYHRMNPLRLFPLLVALSHKEILAVAKRAVSQSKTASFKVALDADVEVEPILPGCTCYPPKAQMPVRMQETSTTFWVVPHVLGQVMQARVVVRQNGQVLAEAPLELRVVKQGLTLFLGALSLVLPVLLVVLKQFRLDLESQFQDGFGLYAQMLDTVVRYVSPEILLGVLLVATGVAYFWLRPRQRDVFWDIKTVGPAESRPEPLTSTSAADNGAATPTAAILREADEHFLRGEYRPALDLYQHALSQATGGAIDYSRAALAANHLGEAKTAMAILECAVVSLHPKKIPGVIWFNMACFATRLGRLAEAVRCLNRAIDAGYNNIAKFERDPDLAPLRWRTDFKRLLLSCPRS